MTPARVDGVHWYALAVHARSEQSAARDLVGRVDEVFVPSRRERRAWSDRVVVRDEPLFPGYVFVRTLLTAERRVSLLRSRFVHDVVGRDLTRVAGPSVPALIAQPCKLEEIEALRIVVAADRAVDPIERLVVGKHISIVSGPLRGASGVVDEGPDGQRRLVVQLALLGRGVRTVLCADDVVEAPSGATSGHALRVAG